jgi:hypothetical protein
VLYMLKKRGGGGQKKTARKKNCEEKKKGTGDLLRAIFALHRKYKTLVL